MNTRDQAKTVFLGIIIDLIHRGKSPYKVSKDFKISRTTIVKYLKELEEKGIIESEGKVTRRKYKLKTTTTTFEVTISKDSEEHLIYDEFSKSIGKGFTKNALLKLEYVVTEMINNVIEHSEANKLTIHIRENFLTLECMLMDNGIGIFKKIMNSHNLKTPEDAILKLSKGKLTSDPLNHSGEGIFFSSRMTDSFLIHSKNSIFTSQNNFDLIQSDDICCISKDFKKIIGTTVVFILDKNNSTSMVEIFNKYENEFNGFENTEMLINLAEKYSKTLMSRSIAKRVIADFNSFKEIILDFKNVEMVGQGFLDEIFRVYKSRNHEINIKYLNENDDIKALMLHVFSRIEEL